MMDMSHNAWDEVYTKTDSVDAYKNTMMTLAFDGSEDHLASKKLIDLVSKEMLARRLSEMFREDLTKPVSTLKESKNLIASPEWVRREKQRKNFDEPLQDGRAELYGGDGDDR